MVRMSPVDRIGSVKLDLNRLWHSGLGQHWLSHDHDTQASRHHPDMSPIHTLWSHHDPGPIRVAQWFSFPCWGSWVRQSPASQRSSPFFYQYTHALYALVCINTIPFKMEVEALNLKQWACSSLWYRVTVSKLRYLACVLLYILYTEECKHRRTQEKKHNLPVGV